ncbi:MULTISPECIES: endonuclease/exonuclease/phosphatase family protein [unclassified Azospirillum]|uniref:endonuclease/exonuclease/phosphatase family protein n=1 Tax=unclassified Azospirillum TaxID=2630922 RepID=UPI000B6C741A|nr:MULTISPECIES: endonuclease/exonuclease/phosphatase family protein [unclassified Azospirillum]SNR94055.1 Uncharacterized conserved protein YafD, endonuclease/exonuclease/phosphatase (EEP) superfamily [Azospirillum sp. RU38E]SNS10039.1 Uncharacterized conserved protein YafD, endonuclease/exonuclease/phosphatase (EEP) superfamily [Azospirillum sp. RU37A]
MRFGHHFLSVMLGVIGILLGIASLPIWGESVTPQLAPLEHLRIGFAWLSIGLLMVTLPLRRFLAALVFGLIAFLNLFYLLPTFLTLDRGAPPPAAQHFTLLHANIWNRNPTTDAIAAMVNRERPDIAVMLETFHGLQEPWLPALDLHWPYRADCGAAGCANLILSRWPLTILGQNSSWFNAKGSPATLAVRVHHPAGDFTLVATHLAQPFDPVFQAQEGAWLARYLLTLPPPLVVTGDFNSAPWSPLIRKLEQQAGITRIARTGPTWPSGPLNPFGIPIDHMLGGPGVSAANVRRLPPFGSDHLALLAEIALTPQAVGPAKPAGEGGGTAALVPTP